jgi:hypothetical protein
MFVLLSIEQTYDIMSVRLSNIGQAARYVTEQDRAAPYSVRRRIYCSEFSIAIKDGQIRCPATALLCRTTQWGQLGEILGGVRRPECVPAQFSLPPMAREVVSNRAIKQLIAETAGPFSKRNIISSTCKDGPASYQNLLYERIM